MKDSSFSNFSIATKLVEILVESFMTYFLDPVYMGSDPKGIASTWIRFTFLSGVYTGSEPEILAFTRDPILLDFMNF